MLEKQFEKALSALATLAEANREIDFSKCNFKRYPIF